MNINELLTAEQKQYFTTKNDFSAFRILITNWLMITLAFFIVAKWPNIFTILFSLIVLGNRQLGLAVLMHECGHRIFFATKEYNEFFGQWFCAYPALQDMQLYAKGHLKHHQFSGTPDDPDLNNYQHYPIDKASFKRKIIRDLTGQTGFKLLIYLFGSLKDPITGTKRNRDGFIKGLQANAILLLVLTIFGVPQLYLLWLVAFLTTFMLFLRLRQVAEHGAVPDLLDTDPQKNTRTTLASWWERLTFAPNFVNYHLEHHMLASVPNYRLPEFHQFLKNQGALESEGVFPGYLAVFRHAVHS